MRIKHRECGSVAKGKVSKGCELCTKGSKMVLFITGRCGTGCAYCPISVDRKGRDVMYANERLVNSIDEIIEEAVMMNAEGTGITGGDPLVEMERTVSVIRALKERFGKGHHIHLYTSTIDPDKVRTLAGAGLDEIRFHPPAGLWRSVRETDLPKIVKAERIDIGLEVPGLPGHSDDLMTLIEDAFAVGIDFVNVNELEFSESNWGMMEEFDYKIKDDVSAAIMGSRELALDIIERSKIPIHFCSSSFKDSVQLRRRLIRRAECTAREFDVITEEGTILTGIVHAEDVNEAFAFLRKKGVPERLMSPSGRTIEMAPWVLEKIASDLPYRCYISERYPTADRLEVERVPLN